MLQAGDIVIAINQITIQPIPNLKRVIPGNAVVTNCHSLQWNLPSGCSSLNDLLVILNE
jgi:hypothetical protein